MNSKFLAAAVFAVALVPALANAASSFDPSVDSGSSPFIAQPTNVNPANAVAAAADAQLYQGVSGNAVIGTHGVSAQAVTEYDPGASEGQPAFVTKVVIPGASAPVVHQSSGAYADNSDLIGS